MGFKKSSDGRVFFTSSNSNEAPDAAPLTGRKAPRPEMLSDEDQTQAQILGVLKSVNERLRVTKQERDAMRRDLENYKELVKTLHAKTVKTEKLLEDGGAGGADDKRVDALHDKVVNALSKTAQLERKIEKVAQDRTRMLRKMERIEEQVMKTNEMLTARAMVLLTDQSDEAAGVAALPPKENQTPQFLLDEELDLRPWWKRSKALSILAVAGLFAGGLAGGWLINNAQQPNFPMLTNETTRTFEVMPQASRASQRPESLAQEAPLAVPPVQDYADIVSENAGAFAPQANNAAAEAPAIDLNDDAALVEAFEADPDALATELNRIEPSATPPQETEPPIAAVQDAPAFQGRPETSPTQTTQIDITPDANLPDVVKAIEAQAFEGVPEAQHDLAAIYTAGHGGVEQNYERAALWFAKAAENGVANAAYNLGVLHHQGIGVRADLDEAIRWYNRAADLDHPEAQYNLGIAYVEGIGVPYDPQQATTYFMSAATQGIMEAAYNLGLIYENGLLGSARPEEALIWYKAAADQGSPEARAALEQLARNLDIPMERINEIVEDIDIVPGQQSRNESGQSVVMTTAGDPGLVSEIQKQLMRIGLYPGPADGQNGQLTQDSIRSYQAVHNLEVSGQASQDLLDHLLLQSVGGMTLNN